MASSTTFSPAIRKPSSSTRTWLAGRHLASWAGCWTKCPTCIRDRAVLAGWPPAAILRASGHPLSGSRAVRQGYLGAQRIPYYFRVLETADEYFDYYRKRHAFWKMYGLDL